MMLLLLQRADLDRAAVTTAPKALDSAGRWCIQLPLTSCVCLGACLQEDGVNLEEWYCWLAAFTGRFCKKYP